MDTGPQDCSPYPPVWDVAICGRLRVASELVAVGWWLLDGESTPDVDGRSSSAMTSAALREMATMREASLAGAGAIVDCCRTLTTQQPWGVWGGDGEKATTA
jgi:hypothetical protein